VKGEVRLDEMPRGYCRFLLCCGVRCWRPSREFWLRCRRPFLLSLFDCLKDLIFLESKKKIIYKGEGSR
jgi:hypothetical protein